MKKKLYSICLIQKRIFLFIFFILTTYNSNGQFFQKIYPVKKINNYTSIEKIPNSTRIIIGESDGSLHLSLDNGNTISDLSSPSIGSINSIKFIDSLNGYFASNLGEIFSTNNGGNSWSLIYYNPLLSFNELEMHISGKMIGICNEGYYVLSDTNRVNWEAYQFENKKNLNTVASLSNSKTVIVGDSGLIVSSVDFINWNEWIFDSTKNLNSINFPDTIIGYISGGEGLYNKIILKTIDGGTTWNTHLGNLETILNADKMKSIFFVSQNKGFMVGSHHGSHLYETLDGGNTWTAEYYSNAEINELYFYDDQSGFMFGNYDHLLKTNDVGANWFYIDKSLSNAVIEDASFVSDSVGYCVGNYGLIMKTEDYGNNWEFLHDEFIYTNASSVHFLNNQIGFVGYSNGDIYKTIDGGTTFNEVYKNPYSNPKAIFNINFYNDTIGIAVGWYSIVLLTNDGGETWTESPNIFAEDYIFERVHYFDLNYIITTAKKRQVPAGDQPSVVMKSFDGGISWDLITELEYMVYDMQFTSNSIGYIGARSGKMYKTYDGGETWNELSISPGCNSCTRFHYFFNDNEGYTICWDGLLKTIDGGQSWSLIPYYENQFVRGDIHFPDNNQDIGYILGDFGVITGDVGNVVIIGQEEICFGNDVTLTAMNGGDISWANVLTPDVIIDTTESITMFPLVSASYIAYSNNGTDTFDIVVNEGTDVIPICNDIYAYAGGIDFWSPTTLSLGDFSYQFQDFSYLRYMDLSCENRITLTDTNILVFNFTNPDLLNRSYSIWLDLNNDGTFTNSELLMSDSLTTKTTDSILLTDAVSGKYLRCRIGISISPGTIQSCPTTYASQTGYIDISIKVDSIIPYTEISGRLFVDINQNGIHDTIDVGTNQVSILSFPQSDFTFTQTDGNYNMSFSDSIGNYQIQPEALPYWNIVTDSLSYNIEISSSPSSLDSLDFGIYPDTLVTEIGTSLIGGFPRCNNTINYWINLLNRGTTKPSGLVQLKLADSISFVTAATAPDSVVGQNIYWHYDSLFYFTEEMIYLQVHMPPFSNIGDTLTSILWIHELDYNNNISYTSSDTLNQILVCAYDPNDKSVNPKGVDGEGYISQNEEMEYLIRFQNTGNDTALNVTIKDNLDPNLDWSTFKPVASSHTMQVTVEQDGLVVFKFDNIMLPDSNVNSVGSQGFVAYSVSLLPNLAPYTTIINAADIYFDSNPSVITNTVLNTINNPSSVHEISFTESNKVIIFPNPFKNNVTVYFKTNIDIQYTISLFDITGKEIFRQNNISSNIETTIDLSNLTRGVFIIGGTDNLGKRLFSKAIIAQ